MKNGGRALGQIVLALVLLGLVLPILAGSFQTLRAAFGLHSALSEATFSLAHWRTLAELPGFATSLWLTLKTGIGSTVLTLILALSLCMVMASRSKTSLINRLANPILAVPHAALAIGLAFVIAPAGWLSRLVGSALEWTQPPILRR